LRDGIPDSALQRRRRITDFSPRSWQFPKIRQRVFQQLRVIPILSNGARFAIAKQP
jgi:hypothetical protein